MQGEWKVEGGTVIGLVADKKDEKAEPTKTENAPKKRTRKTKGESE